MTEITILPFFKKLEFSRVLHTMLYIVSVSKISSSTSTNSSLVHSKSKLLVLYKFFFLGQLLLKWSNSPHAEHLSLFLYILLGLYFLTCLLGSRQGFLLIDIFR